MPSRRTIVTPVALCAASRRECVRNLVTTLFDPERRMPGELTSYRDHRAVLYTPRLGKCFMRSPLAGRLASLLSGAGPLLRIPCHSRLRVGVYGICLIVIQWRLRCEGLRVSGARRARDVPPLRAERVAAGTGCRVGESISYRPWRNGLSRPGHALTSG